MIWSVVRRAVALRVMCPAGCSCLGGIAAPFRVCVVPGSELAKSQTTSPKIAICPIITYNIAISPITMV